MDNFVVTTIICLGTVLVAPQVHAQQAQNQGAGSGPPLSIRVLANMGRAGLLGNMSSNERYGTVQSRVAGGRGMAALAAMPGNPASGYSDDLTDTLTPLSVIYRLDRGPSENASYLRFASQSRWTDADRTRNASTDFESDSEAHGFDLQYLFAPDADTLFGIGIEANRNQVDIEHAGGESEIEYVGLRADLLKVLNPNWGIALRAHWFDETADARIPLPFTTLRTEQDAERIYLQADAIGTYTQQDIASLPSGWALRPHVGMNWQKTRFEETVNSLGATSVGPGGNSSDEYGSVYGKVSLMRAGSEAFKPYFGVGIDHEFTNTYDDLVDEDTYLNSFIGASYSLSQSAMINVSYGRYDGLNGNRDKDNFVFAVGMTF